MAVGIDWMITVVLWVANLPGAAGRIHAFGPGPLLVATAGLLLICLLRTPLRWSGAVLAIIACLWAVLTPRPDILVAADGQAAAIRGRNGQLSVLHSGRDSFAIKEWLAADGDTRDVKDASLRTLKDGRPVSMALSADAFVEDCARAAVVVSARQAPGDCAALLADRRAWRANGAIALRLVGDRFELTSARPAGSERPWAPAVRAATERTPARRPVAPDATPRTGDLEEGDQ
jgi:competence protein ComEC